MEEKLKKLLSTYIFRPYIVMVEDTILDFYKMFNMDEKIKNIIMGAEEKSIDKENTPLQTTFYETRYQILKKRLEDE